MGRILQRSCFSYTVIWWLPFALFLGGKITLKYRRILKLRGDLGELCPQLSQVSIASMIGACWTSSKRQHQSRNSPTIQQAFPQQEAPLRPAGVRGTMAVTSGGHAERGATFRFSWKENLAEFWWAPLQQRLSFLNRRQKGWCSLLSTQDYKHLASSSPAHRGCQHHHWDHLGPHFPWAIRNKGQLRRMVQ